jgi:hypothetical protein
LELELLVVSSFVIQDKFVHLELELLVVPSCVIPRQICGGVLGSQFFSLNMGNRQIRERNSSRKEKPIEKVEEEREKEKLRMSKHRLSEEGNPISSRIDVIVVSPPSPQEKCRSSVETNPCSISSRQLVVDDQMMEDFLGADYTMDEIREETGAQHCGEEVLVVQPLVGQSDVPETSQSHVHSPPIFDPPVIEGERTATLLTPQQGGQECQNRGSSSLPRLSSVRRRTPKCIQVDESGLASLEGKLPNHTIHYHSYKIIKEYFEPKSDAAKCQLFLALLKSRSLTVVRRILGIKTVKSLETSHHIVRNLVDVFQRIGKKSHSKDHNAARHVLSQSIVSKITRKHHFLQQTSHLMKCNVKTLRKYSHR